jgi:hypothetical protein
MPAPVAYRRWDSSSPETLAPASMYAPTQRFAIVALGVVVAVSTLPLGTLPPLLTGQSAVLSTTLNVGDRV